jgi:PTH1 family peptidyl-tRNA hydrolase
MKLIVGLGNPGRGYANNRHNIGFMCLNHFARSHGIKFDKKQAQARTGSGEIAGSNIILAKPQTYMNLSGQSVILLVKKFKIDPEELIIIHDDLDLPLGTIRIRHGSSSGGHKGINSIISHLGSQDFYRIRIGIGRPDISEISEDDIASFVLSDFSPEEKRIIDQVISSTGEAILCLLTDGLITAMNRYNKNHLNTT